MKELDIAFHLSDQIITFWQFYVAGVLAALGWVFSRKTGWPGSKRLVLSLAMAGFMFLNAYGLYKAITALNGIVDVLRSDEMKNIALNKTVLKFSLARLYQYHIAWMIVPHLVTDLIVLYFVGVKSQKNPNVGNEAH